MLLTMGPVRGYPTLLTFLIFPHPREVSAQKAEHAHNSKTRSSETHRRRATMLISYLVLTGFCTRGSLFSAPFLSSWHLRTVIFLPFCSKLHIQVALLPVLAKRWRKEEKLRENQHRPTVKRD